jgi:hypothetical protein
LLHPLRDCRVAVAGVRLGRHRHRSSPHCQRQLSAPQLAVPPRLRPWLCGRGVVALALWPGRPPTRQLRRRPPGPSRRWRPPLLGMSCGGRLQVWVSRKRPCSAVPEYSGQQDSFLIAPACDVSEVTGPYGWASTGLSLVSHEKSHVEGPAHRAARGKGGRDGRTECLRRRRPARSAHTDPSGPPPFTLLIYLLAYLPTCLFTCVVGFWPPVSSGSVPGQSRISPGSGSAGRTA